MNVRGKFMVNISLSISQFKHRIIVERTCASLDAARTRGRLGSRKPITELAAQKLH